MKKSQQKEKASKRRRGFLPGQGGGKGKKSTGTQPKGYYTGKAAGRKDSQGLPQAEELSSPNGVRGLEKNAGKAGGYAPEIGDGVNKITVGIRGRHGQQGWKGGNESKRGRMKKEAALRVGGLERDLKGHQKVIKEKHDHVVGGEQPQKKKPKTKTAKGGVIDKTQMNEGVADRNCVYSIWERSWDRKVTR